MSWRPTADPTETQIPEPDEPEVEAEIELASADKEIARKQIDDACRKILSNPVIEDYRFEIE